MLLALDQFSKLVQRQLQLTVDAPALGAHRGDRSNRCLCISDFKMLLTQPWLGISNKMTNTVLLTAKGVQGEFLLLQRGT